MAIFDQKSTTTASKVMQPAGWRGLGDTRLEDIFDRWYSGAFGAKGTIASRIMGKGSAYQENLAEDNQARQDASQNLVNQSTGIENDLINSLTSATNKYTGDIDRITQQNSSPKFNINVGGQTLGVIPQGNINLMDQLANMSGKTYNANSTLAGNKRNSLSGLAQMQAGHDSTFTPNQSYFQYMDYLGNLANHYNDQRFQIPSSYGTTTTTNTPSLFNAGYALSNALSGPLTGGMNWLSGLGGNMGAGGNMGGLTGMATGQMHPNNLNGLYWSR